MQIKVKPVEPKPFVGVDFWQPKLQGVVLVEKEEDIEPLYKLLCAQDDYWESPYARKLIKVAPKEIESELDLMPLCDSVGKLDIYDVPKIKSQIPFIIYQYWDDY
jgi:hypothetical protein